jgi:hypothetical protein
MEDIIEEYRNFVSQKLQMIDTIKLVTKQLIDKMEDIQLPKIKKLFMKLGNIENDNDFKCTFCNSWSGRNKASLGAHIRNCKFNPKNKEINILTASEQTNDFNEGLIENIVINFVEPIIHDQVLDSTTSNKKDKVSKSKPKTK